MEKKDEQGSIAAALALVAVPHELPAEEPFADPGPGGSIPKPCIEPAADALLLPEKDL